MCGRLDWVVSSLWLRVQRDQPRRRVCRADRGTKEMMQLPSVPPARHLFGRAHMTKEMINPVCSTYISSLRSGSAHDSIELQIERFPLHGRRVGWLGLGGRRKGSGRSVQRRWTGSERSSSGSEKSGKGQWKIQERQRKVEERQWRAKERQ